MAQTNKIEMTDTYQLVVSTNEGYVLQNVGNSPIELLWKDTAPLATDRGHVITQTDGVITAWGYGDIYARSSTGEGKLIVTK